MTAKLNYYHPHKYLIGKKIIKVYHDNTVKECYVEQIDGDIGITVRACNTGKYIFCLLSPDRYEQKFGKSVNVTQVRYRIQFNTLVKMLQKGIFSQEEYFKQLKSKPNKRFFASAETCPF